MGIPARQRKRGSKIQLRFAETLTMSGEFYTDNLRSAKQTDMYYTKGGGTERWEPRFTYHGFRYVELTGYPGKPNVNTIEGKVIYDEHENNWRLQLLKRHHQQSLQCSVLGIRGNYRSIPTDCPS